MSKTLEDQIQSCREDMDLLPQWCRTLLQYTSDAPPPELRIAKLKAELNAARGHVRRLLVYGPDSKITKELAEQWLEEQYKGARQRSKAPRTETFLSRHNMLALSPELEQFYAEAVSLMTELERENNNLLSSEAAAYASIISGKHIKELQGRIAELEKKRVENVFMASKLKLANERIAELERLLNEACNALGPQHEGLCGEIYETIAAQEQDNARPD